MSEAEKKTLELIKEARKRFAGVYRYQEDVEDGFIDLANYAEKKRIHETKNDIWLMIDCLKGVAQLLDKADYSAIDSDNYEVRSFAGTDNEAIYSVHFTLKGAREWVRYIVDEDICDDVNPDITVNGSTEY